MKYYTPELEEFFPGFEFQEFYAEGWHDRICWKDDFQNILSNDEDVDFSNYKVKYLDEQDIEDLGWELQGESPSPYTGRPLKTFKITKEIGFNTGIDYFLETSDSIKIMITIFDYSHYGGGKEEMSFTIKNKNELRKLMIQIGI